MSGSTPRIYLLDSHLLRIVLVTRRCAANHPIELAITSQVLLGDLESLLLGDHSIHHIATREPVRLRLVLRWSMTQLLDRRLTRDWVLLYLWGARGTEHLCNNFFWHWHPLLHTAEPTQTCITIDV